MSRVQKYKYHNYHLILLGYKPKLKDNKKRDKKTF